MAQPQAVSPTAAPGAARASAGVAASGARSPLSPSGLRSVRSSKLKFTEMEDAATRVRKYLTGELGQGVADVILREASGPHVNRRCLLHPRANSLLNPKPIASNVPFGTSHTPSDPVDCCGCECRVR